MTYYSMLFKNGLSKAFTMSWDDGLEQDVPVIEALNKNGIKATFNLNSGLYAPEGTVYDKDWLFKRMSYSGCTKTFLNSGHEVAMHSSEHPELTHCTREIIAAQIVRDKLALEKQFGQIIRGYACPWGTVDDKVEEALRVCGVAYARTVEATHDFRIPENWLRLPVTCHQADEELMSLAEKFVSAEYTNAQMFYVWGHSYEFDARGDWERFEAFAKYVGGRSDIWYATNIEIFDYVSAFKNVISSSDGTILMNPTSTELYLYAANLDTILHGAKGEILKLPAGGTLYLGE